MNNSNHKELEIKKDKRGRPKKEPTKIIRIPISLEPIITELKKLHEKLDSKSKN